MTHSDNDPQAKVVGFPEADSLSDQAARWVARLDADNPDKATLNEFKHWIKQNPEHRAEFEKYMAMWGDMNVLATMVPPAPAKAAPPGRAGAIGWRFQWPGVVAMGLVICVAVVLQFTVNDPNHYHTAIGEQQQVQLKDGTLVTLNTNTELRVAYTDQRRTVYLSRGEAHFEVAHNPARPFEVHAGQGKVRAVGTAFTVYLKSDDVEVVVTEGEIEILPSRISLAQHQSGSATVADKTAPAATGAPESKAQPNTRVKAGGIATYDLHTAEHILLKALADDSNKLAWRNGMLVFRDEPLVEVIEEVNRYTELKIIIPESSVRDIKVGGFFKVSDIESVFDALEKGFDIRAEYISEDVVYLVRRQP